MKINLNIIIDTSGSMNEMGKIHLQRNLCRYINQLNIIDSRKYSNINISYYKWAQDISRLNIQKDRDLPSLVAVGAANLKFLYSFLSQNINDTKILKVLILSDGFFPNSDILNFQKQLSLFHSLVIRTVAIGADADLLKLKKISTNNSVYLSENITSAIDSSIFDSDKPFVAPFSMAQILQSEPAETEEPEEDWDA